MHSSSEKIALRALALAGLLVFWLFSSTGCGAAHVGREIGMDPVPTVTATTTTTDTDEAS